MAELSVYTYPWEVADLGAEATIDWAAGNGVDRLMVAAAYHSAEVIAPRRTHRVQTHVEANVSHLDLSHAGFEELALPNGSLAIEQADLFPVLSRAARDAGVALSGWVVMFHNSDLAQRVPEAALENCFGDRSAHGLCPANPVVQRYAGKLVAAVAQTGHFDELMVESLSYLLAGHGHPHELWAVRMDPVCRALASLCFCSHCLDRGAAEGIDGGALREWVVESLHRMWNSPVTGLREPDDGNELAALAVVNTNLGGWIRMRCEVVTELLVSVAAVARANDVRLAMGGPVWARPLPHSWLEGIDIAACAQHCERIVVMPYYETSAAVLRDLDFATVLAAPAKFQVAQTLWPAHHGGRLENLLDKVRLAQTLRFTQFGLYNFSMAPQPVIEWVRAVADVVHADRTLV